MAATPITAVIFDCDGTLVDSELLNARGVADLFAIDHGVDLDALAIEREFRGGKFEAMIDTLAARHGVTVADDFTTRYREYMYDLFSRALEPMPGVRDAIEAIDLPKCVASSGPEKKLAVALESTDLARYFGDLVFSAYTIGVWKPEPALFFTAAAALDVPPAECAVIEDSDAGVEAARRAGMRVFGYDPHGAIGEHPDAKLTRFSDFRDLPDLLNRYR
ncbi:6-phosphogluconate phosphatase [Salinisphaera dokdonensis CL-ES53]|uniref:6-phosphogluconate phosphatase n=1 Tax=Salinisphaera dokdonensis CL-ES53 TaxID=1304272 RepID=A0ABV2AYI3_9GAMM